MTEKLANLIIYIAAKCQMDDAFGATKLNKILFTADFVAHGAWGRSISGATYRKLKNGPVPHELPIVRNRLERESKIVIQERSYFGRTQKRIIPMITPDLSIFTAEEIQLVDQVIAATGPLNGTQLSEWSHTLRPWLSARDGETIPYVAVFTLKDIPVSSEGLLWGATMIEELQASGGLQC